MVLYSVGQKWWLQWRVHDGSCSIHVYTWNEPISFSIYLIMPNENPSTLKSSSFSVNLRCPRKITLRSTVTNVIGRNTRTHDTRDQTHKVLDAGCNFGSGSRFSRGRSKHVEMIVFFPVIVISIDILHKFWQFAIIWNVTNNFQRYDQLSNFWAITYRGIILSSPSMALKLMTNGNDGGIGNLTTSSGILFLRFTNLRLKKNDPIFVLHCFFCFFLSSNL